MGYVGKSVGYVTIRTHTFRQMKSISSDMMWYNTVADKKVPTTYHLFNVADKKKTARFKRSFTSVDVVSA